jgi:hypothetical protein
MIRRLALVLSLTLSAVLCTGCHHIKSDYPAFLAQHPPKPALSHVPVSAQYTIAEETMRHSITYRSVAAGYGNKWILEVGQMLDQTMQSAAVRGAFGSLTMLEARHQLARITSRWSCRTTTSQTSPRT